MLNWRKYWLFNPSGLRELIPHNLRGFLSTFSSLSNRNFAIYFAGQCVSLCGSWIQFVAMGYLITYELKGSVFMLTAMAFLNQIPNLLLTPFAGVLIDKFNKYKILIGTQILFMCQAIVMAALVLSGTLQMWHIMALSLFSGIVNSVDAPTRQSFYAYLVPRRHLTNAIALNSVSFNGSRFIGPSLGALLIEAVGVGYCFVINAVSFIAVLAALFSMKLEMPAPVKRKIYILSDFREGVRYVKGFMPLKAVLFFVATISFFGLPFMTVIPALVKGTFGGNVTLLGTLQSCVGAGALCSALYLASRKQVLGLGKVVTLNAAIMGLSLMSIAIIRSPIMACVVAVPVGFSLIGSLATCNTLLQSMVEDHMRGRVMSFYTMAFAGMAPIGGLLYGWFAQVTSLPTAIFVSGMICIAAGIIYEFYRPRVRAAARDRYTMPGRMNKEIATGIGEGFVNPF